MAIQLINILASGVTDNSGLVLSGGLVYFYVSDSTTQADVYQDVALTEPHPNPATLDTAGRLIAYSNDSIKCVIKTSDGVSVRTVDYVSTGDIFESDASVPNEVMLNDSSTIAAKSNVLPLISKSTNADPSWEQAAVVAFAADAVETAKIKAANVTTAKLAADAVETAKIKAAQVTLAKRDSLGQQSASFSFNSTKSWTFTPIPNYSVTLTSIGRPVFVALIPQASINGKSTLYFETTGLQYVTDHTDIFAGYIRLYRDATTIVGNWYCRLEALAYAGLHLKFTLPMTLVTIDAVAAGEHVYTLEWCVDSSYTTMKMGYMTLMAFEL